jgi:MFS family permease
MQFSSVPNAAYLVPMIITLPSLVIALFSPAAGWLTDRFGRRPVFIASLTLYAVAGLAPLGLSDIRLIVVSRGILGVAEAGVVTVASTLIADYFGDDRHRWLAIQSGLGSVLGTLLIAFGGWLATFSWRGPFSVYVAAIPLLLLSIVFIDEPVIGVRVEASQARGTFPWVMALVIGLVSLVASALYYVEPTQIASLFSERGVQSSSRIGLLQASVSVAYIAGAYLYKRVSDRGVSFQLAIAGGLIGLGMTGIGLSGTYLQAALWAVPQQLGGGMVIPTLIAWAQGSMPFDQRGRAMGIWATFFFSGLFLCPTIVNLTATAAGGLSAAFWLLGLITCGLAAICLVKAFGVRHSAARS